MEQSNNTTVAGNRQDGAFGNQRKSDDDAERKERRLLGEIKIHFK